VVAGLGVSTRVGDNNSAFDALAAVVPRPERSDSPLM
jgi:hypothetical protein